MKGTKRGLGWLLLFFFKLDNNFQKQLIHCLRRPRRKQTLFYLPSTYLPTAHILFSWYILFRALLHIIIVVDVKIVPILNHFLIIYFHSFMASTKAVDPRMTPHRIMMLTSTMYEHLYIPELIPIV